MSQDEFTKLFTYMQQQFREIRAETDGIRTDVRQVYGVVDAIAKNQETDEQERLMANHQLDRHEDWITRAAEHINVSYNPAA